MLKLGQENDFDEFFKEVENNDSTKYIFEFMEGIWPENLENFESTDAENYGSLVNKFLSNRVGDNYVKYQSNSDANFYDGCNYVWIRTIKPMTCKEFYNFMKSDYFWHDDDLIFRLDAGNTKVIKIVE